MGIALTTDSVEIELDVDQVERLIRAQIPNAKVEVRDNRAYIVVPIDAVAPVRYENGKFKVKVPVPRLPGVKP